MGVVQGADRGKATLRILHEMHAYGVGVTQTSLNLAQAMHGAGMSVHVYTARLRHDQGALPTTTGLPRVLNRWFTPRSNALAAQRARRAFLRDFQPRDVAWLWPSVDASVHREMARRGAPIIMEGVNTRISNARRILERDYAAEGMALRMSSEWSFLSDETIAAEDRKLASATHFFAPSPAVEEDILAPDSPFRGTVMRSDYGAWRPSDAELARLRADAPPRDKPVVLFVGKLMLRKGVHHLLRAWARAGPDARLVLCGSLHDKLAELCAAELALPSVEHRGFVADMPAAYAAADAFVLPSLEEGSPLVTAEAAAHGLPLVVSRMGAGGYWGHEDAVLRVDPHDGDGLAEALTRIVADADLRSRLGQRARALSRQFDWAEIGRRRVAALCDAFPDRDLMA
jgi:glycosyltransferase involved in cell wall biosynthesis